MSEQQYINLLLAQQQAQTRRWMEGIGVKPSLKKFGYIGCITFHLETGLGFIRSICCTSVYIIEQDFHFHEFVLNRGTELTKQNTRRARLRTVGTQVEILTAAMTSY